MSTPSVLSEKARGKRRATEIDDAQPSVPSEIPLRSFTVRFSEGLPDLELSVDPKDTVREVLRRIRVERPTLGRRRLRLIHSGRLLTNGTLLHAWLVSLEERQNLSRKSLVLGSPTNDPSSGVWLHCSVGPELPPDEVDEDKIQTAQLTPLRGFDRLTTAGFTPEDIENVRRQFHSSRGEDPLSDGALNENAEDADEHARALEEQWIDDMDGSTIPVEANVSGEAIYTTLLQGILAGFFFPLLPFFFIRDPRPAAFFSDSYQTVEGPGNVVFSRRMLMAIVVGFVSNIAYGAMRYFAV